MSYRLGFDQNPDDPNPGLYVLGLETYATEREAREAGERDDAQALLDYDGDAERAGVGNWIIVYDPPEEGHDHGHE